MAQRAQAMEEAADGVRSAERLAHSLVSTAEGTVEAVIFYGSHLHGTPGEKRGAVDLIVVVRDYSAFHRALRAAGVVRRPPVLLTLLAHMLPPNSIAFRPLGEAHACAKCLVVSAAHLERSLGRRPPDLFLHARLAQPVELVYARDASIATGIHRQLRSNRRMMLEWLAPHLPDTFDAGTLGLQMLEVAYRHEVRPESTGRSAELFARQRDRWSRDLERALEDAAQDGTVERTGRDCQYRLVRIPSRSERRRTRWYLARSNARSVARWAKYIITFDGWLPYIAAKVERHSGRPVILSPREQRWPLLFLWPRLVATLRARNTPGRRAPPPKLGARASVAFHRDPAAFMSGPGLAVGDLYRVRAPGHRVVVVTDPDLAEDILVRHQEHFVKSRIYWRELRTSFGASMGALDGQEWRRRHNAQRPRFTPRAVEAILPEVASHTNSFLRVLASRIGDGGEVRVTQLFAELNARVVLRILFGQDAGDDASRVAELIREGHELIAWRSRFPWRPFVAALTGRSVRGQRIAAELRRYGRSVGESAAASDPRLLLHTLVKLARGGPADDLVTNEIVFHLAASTETQAAAEAWTAHLLWQHPAVLARLREEIAAACGSEPATDVHLHSLTFCRQVVQESLRLYPPVHAILRDCVSSAALRGHYATPGESFVISIYGMHRSPRRWDEPDRFVPDRFADGAVSAMPRFQYLPFGAGRRVCIGRHLALPSIVLTVARFAQLFDWGFAEVARPESLTSLRPPSDLTMSLVPRRVST